RAEHPGAAGLHVGRFAERGAAEAVERVGFVEDAVGAAHRPLLERPPRKTNTRAEVPIADLAEVTFACAALAAPREIVSALHSGGGIDLIRVPARYAVVHFLERRL